MGHSLVLMQGRQKVWPTEPPNPLMASHSAPGLPGPGPNCPEGMCLPSRQKAPAWQLLSSPEVTQSSLLPNPCKLYFPAVPHGEAQRRPRMQRTERGTTHGLVCKMPGWALGLPGSQ